MVVKNLWKTPLSIVAYRNYHAENSKSMQSNFPANCKIQSMSLQQLMDLFAASIVKTMHSFIPKYVCNSVDVCVTKFKT